MTLYPLENVIHTCQIPTINFLDEWGIIGKWNTDTKRVFLHFFLKEIHSLLDTVDYFVFSEVPKCLELFEYIESSKFIKFFERFIRKLSKLLTRRIVIISPTVIYPHIIEDEEELSFWYGEFYDELRVQTNREEKDNIKQIKKYFQKHSFTELQTTFQTKKLI